jgi:hypothetical protein
MQVLCPGKRRNRASVSARGAYHTVIVGCDCGDRGAKAAPGQSVHCGSTASERGQSAFARGAARCPLTTWCRFRFPRGFRPRASNCSGKYSWALQSRCISDNSTTHKFSPLLTPSLTPSHTITHTHTHTHMITHHQRSTHQPRGHGVVLHVSSTREPRSSVFAATSSTLLRTTRRFGAIKASAAKLSLMASSARLLMNASPSPILDQESLRYVVPLQRVAISSFAAPNQHALVVFACGDPVQHLNSLTRNGRIQALQSELVRWFGPKAASPLVCVPVRQPDECPNSHSTHPQAIDEENWSLNEWSRGCPVSCFPPGVLSSVGPSLREPCGRVLWAGTETAEISPVCSPPCTLPCLHTSHFSWL